MAKKDAPEAAEGGSNKKLIIIIAAVVMLLAGVGVGTYLFLGQKKTSAPGQEQSEAQKPLKTVGPMVNIDPFIVNILDDDQSRYLKAAITIEVDSDRTSQQITDRLPQIKDAILLLIGNKTFNELNDLQGKLQLRAELINRINSILVNGKVKHIYFTDFVVQ